MMFLLSAIVFLVAVLLVVTLSVLILLLPIGAFRLIRSTFWRSY